MRKLPRKPMDQRGGTINTIRKPYKTIRKRTPKLINQRGKTIKTIRKPDKTIGTLYETNKTIGEQQNNREMKTKGGTIRKGGRLIKSFFLRRIPKTARQSEIGS